MCEIKNKRVINFIEEYLNLCKKYSLCIVNPRDWYEIDELSDYDYYDPDILGTDEPLPVYNGMFITSILEHYDAWAWEEDEE